MTPPHDYDCVAIGAHPDDAELFAGGTLARMTRRGARVAIVDLTRGEMATRGTPETRAAEAAKAAEILGVAERVALDLGDAELANSQANRLALAAVLRRLRPRLVLTHLPDERHPDHRRAHELVSDAVFLANVGNFPAAGERWQTSAIAYFPGNHPRAEPNADWVVDVSETIQAKYAALEAYSTQFMAPDGDTGPATYISTPAYFENIDRRARLWGHRIGAQHGEPFVLETPPHAAHPLVELTRP